MHYNQGYGSQIPVPIDHALEQNMVQQLPPLPRTQSASQLPEQEAVGLHAALINGIQQQTAKGPIRIVMFNLYSDRQFCNQMYAELFETAAEYLIAAMTARMPVTPEQVADETLKVEILNLLNRYPELQGYITQQQNQEIQQVMQLKNQISNLVHSVQHQTMGGGYPPQGGGFQQPGGFPQQGPSWQNQGGGWQNQGGGMPVPGGRPGFGPPMGGPSMPGPGMQRGGPMPSMGGGYTQRPGAMHGRSSGPTRPSTSMIDRGSDPAGAPMTSSSRKPTVGAGSVDTANVLTRKEEKSPMKHVPDVDREIGHLMAVQDSKEYAAPIDKDVQFVTDRHAPAITARQRLIVTKSDKGVPSYSVINLEENEMEYADHEEQPDMQKLARETQISKKVGIPADWSRVTLPNVIEENDETVSEDLSLDAPISLKSFVEGYGVDHARTEAQRRLAEKGIASLEGRVVEYYLSVKTPILATNEEARLVESLVHSKDLTNLIDNFIALREDVSSEVWFLLHDRMTCIFNRHLQGGVAFDGEIESIAEDYEEALVALAEELTPVAIDRFKLNVFSSMSKGITSKHSPKTKILDLVEATSVTQLPWSSSEMDLSLPSKYNMITASVASHMHAALLRLFKRTNVTDLSVNRRYLVTADNVWLELVHSDVVGETILISKVNRC
jgi:hypothetical protein